MFDNKQYLRDYYRKNKEVIKARSLARAKQIDPHDLRKTARESARRVTERKYPPTRPRPEFCELCGGKNVFNRALALDHDHATDKFRGWLCGNCNIGLGKLGDNLDGVLRAIKYLQENG